MSQIECPQANADDVLREYVAGRPSDSAAEEFEQHMFECDHCAEEVELALEIRAASKPKRIAGSGWRVGLAVAATLAAVVLGLWQIRVWQEPLMPPPLRSAVGRDISARGSLVGPTFTASWNGVAGARSYRVQIFNAVGEPVTWTETSSTRFSASIGSAPRGEPRYWKVQALDEDRVVIANSPLMKIESR